MSAVDLRVDVMGRKTTPVRLTEEAIRWARIASGYTGESMTEYVSRVIEEPRQERCGSAPRRGEGRDDEAREERREVIGLARGIPRSGLIVGQSIDIGNPFIR